MNTYRVVAISDSEIPDVHVVITAFSKMAHKLVDLIVDEKAAEERKAKEITPAKAAADLIKACVNEQTVKLIDALNFGEELFGSVELFFEVMDKHFSFPREKRYADVDAQYRMVGSVVQLAGMITDHISNGYLIAGE